MSPPATLLAGCPVDVVQGGAMAKDDCMRRVPRLEPGQRLDILMRGVGPGEVMDLSIIGMRIRCSRAAPEGAGFTGELLFEDRPTIRVQGRVAWRSASAQAGWKPAEVGVELSQVPEAYAHMVAELFATRA
jgi:hypothetical protein